MTSAKRLIGEASGGYVGIDAELHVCSGYDQTEVSANLDHVCDGDWDYPNMEASEKVKLADEMIARWTRYRNEALK